MGKINSTGMITHWLLSTVDLPPQRWAQSFRPLRSWRLGAWPEVLRTVGNVQGSYVLPRVQGAHYHERRPRVVVVDRLLPSSLCQDAPIWTAELDEFRSLFQLVCHIQGKTRRYQGAEDRNTDKLLSSFFSSLFSALGSDSLLRSHRKYSGETSQYAHKWASLYHASITKSASMMLFPDKEETSMQRHTCKSSNGLV